MAGQAFLVKMLITLEPCYAFGSIFFSFFFLSFSCFFFISFSFSFYLFIYFLLSYFLFIFFSSFCCFLNTYIVNIVQSLV